MWILWLYILNTVPMIAIAFREARRPATALSYMTISLILPIFGFGFYLIMTKKVQFERERLTALHNREDKLPNTFGPSSSIIAQSLRRLSVRGLRSGAVEVLLNGRETFDELARLIQTAKCSIDLEYYIFRNDVIGSHIIDLLVDRARDGVRIRFLRDGLGSRKLSQSQIERMRNAGIECRTFFPFRFPWLTTTLNYRDHCKIVVVDRVNALTGGINVGDEYAGNNPSIGFWRDTHLKVVGDVVHDLQAIFDAHWHLAAKDVIRAGSKHNSQGSHNSRKRKSRTNRIINSNTGHHIARSTSRLLTESASELGSIEATEPLSHSRTLMDAFVQTLEGNPGLPTQVIRQGYFICLTQAAKTIDITTPYFVPDADIIMAIKAAVARGVRVRLLVPHHVDHKLVGLASRTYYGELLEAGVHIYLYDKGVLHAKVMVIDGEVSVVGAANFDMRSFRLDYEVCEIIYSRKAAQELTEQFERDLPDSIPCRIEDVRQRTPWQRIAEQGARVLAPLL